MAFKIAASMGYPKTLVAEPTRVILEPMMKVEVVTPEKFMGDRDGKPFFQTRFD